MDRKDAGDNGELLALEYLSKAGLRLLIRNYRCRGGEIDLVMLEKQILVLVEVRVRNDQRFGGAAASVNPRKQQRLMLAARHLLLTKQELNRYRARFDVVALGSLELGDASIEWIKDAFRMN